MQFQKFGNKYGGMVDVSRRIDPTKGTPVQREVQFKKATYVPHGGTARVVNQYTGTAMLGIGVMHKSNAVPVFSQEQAEDLSKMRRG